MPVRLIVDCPRETEVEWRNTAAIHLSALLEGYFVTDEPFEVVVEGRESISIIRARFDTSALLKSDAASPAEQIKDSLFNTFGGHYTVHVVDNATGDVVASRILTNAPH